MAETWISEALEIDRALSTLAEPARREALTAQADVRKLSVATLVRQMRAARYVAEQATKDTLAISDVRASAIAIRSLMALEKDNPAEAARVRGDVLSGRLSTRKAAALAKRKSTQPRIVAMHDIAWHDLTSSILESLDEAHAVEYGNRSEIARVFRLDMEVPTAEDKSIAIYLSPCQSHSAFRRRPLSEQIPFVFMAANFFQRVVYFSR